MDENQAQNLDIPQKIIILHPKYGQPVTTTIIKINKYQTK